MYNRRITTDDDLKRYIREGKSLREIEVLSGKNHKWIKNKLEKIFKNRIEFVRGRNGGIKIDGRFINV